MIIEQFVGLVLNTLFPTLVVAIFGVIIGFFTLWVSYKFDSKPTKIQGLAVLALGISYFFSYLGIGDITLRHALIRFSLIWVMLSVVMVQVWRMSRGH